MKVILLRLLVVVVAISVCSLAAPKKSQHIAFVAVSSQNTAHQLANVAKELKNRDSTVRVTMFTYSSYSTFLFKYIHDNETVTFNDQMASVESHKRIQLSSSAAQSPLGHFPEFLSAYSANYDNELASLKMFNETYKPDLFVVDMYALSAMDLSNDLKIPYIVYSQDTTFGVIEDELRGPRNHTLMDKLQLTLQLPAQWQTLSNLSEKVHNHRHFHFATPFNPLSSLYSDRLLLVPSVFGLEVPQPLSPLTRLVGMYVNKDPHSKKPSNGHEKVLLSWLTSSGDQSSVLFCLYSDDSSPSESQLRALVEGGLAAGFRVLIALRHEALSRIGVEYNDLIKGREDSVNMVPFAPLGMVLNAKAVKVFLYQGAELHTVAEGIYAAVPFLLLPATTNQRALADKVMAARLGLLLDNRNFTSEVVAAAAAELQVDKTRRRMVKRMKWLQTVNDQAGSFVNGSVSVIQEVLATGGYAHLVSPARTREEDLLRRLTAYGADVMLVGVGSLFVIAQLFLVMCCCRPARGKEKTKTD